MDWMKRLKMILMPHLKLKPYDERLQTHKVMTETSIKIVAGYVMVVVSWVYAQVSEQVGGIIDRGFDAGLSIGLLTIGIIVLGWYHWKYQQYSRDLIDNLAKEKDKRIDKLNDDKDDRTEELHKIALEQVNLMKDQIRTNEELRDAVKQLEKKI